MSSIRGWRQTAKLVGLAGFDPGRLVLIQTADDSLPIERTDRAGQISNHKTQQGKLTTKPAEFGRTTTRLAEAVDRQRPMPCHASQTAVTASDRCASVHRPRWGGPEQVTPNRLHRSVDGTGVPNASTETHFGVSDRSAQRTSACLRLSMCPTRRTPPHKLTSVWRIDARNGCVRAGRPARSPRASSS